MLDRKAESGHRSTHKNYSQWPPVEKTGRGSLLNRPSCPPDDQISQGTELNNRYVLSGLEHRTPLPETFENNQMSNQVLANYTDLYRRVYGNLVLLEVICCEVNLSTEVLQKRLHHA